MHFTAKKMEADESPDNSDKTIRSVDDDPVNQIVISSLSENRAADD